MSIIPFVTTVIILVVIALLATVLIGLRPEEKKQRNFIQRSRNLLLIYGVITLLMLIALGIYLYNS